MNRTTLVLADIVFVIVLIMVYSTDGLKTYPIILTPFIVAAFATCVIRHINHYNMTKKIY
jgi:hypothetical protein